MNKHAESYRQMLCELVQSGEHDYFSIDPATADLLSWGKFQSQPDLADERLGDAWTCVDGLGGAAVREDWSDFGRLIKIGLSLALADVLQKDLDDECERQRFSSEWEAL